MPTTGSGVIIGGENGGEDSDVEIADTLLEGAFLRRENRFLATVLLDGHEVKAHVPNSGRLHELFEPGRPVLLAHRPGGHRRTEYDLLMVRLDGVLVSVDSRLPNRLFAEAVLSGALSAFSTYAELKPEVQLGRSRIDILLTGKPGKCWVEAKSVTLVENGTAMFPDAVTVRGRRHVEELAAAVAKGDRAAIVFVVQRDDAVRFRPHDDSDPEFGEALRRAFEAGVEVHAYTCIVSERRIDIAREIPVVLHPAG